MAIFALTRQVARAEPPYGTTVPGSPECFMRVSEDLYLAEYADEVPPEAVLVGEGDDFVSATSSPPQRQAWRDLLGFNARNPRVISTLIQYLRWTRIHCIVPTSKNKIELWWKNNLVYSADFDISKPSPDREAVIERHREDLRIIHSRSGGDVARKHLDALIEKYTRDRDPRSRSQNKSLWRELLPPEWEHEGRLIWQSGPSKHETDLTDLFNRTNLNMQVEYLGKSFDTSAGDLNDISITCDIPAGSVVVACVSGEAQGTSAATFSWGGTASLSFSRIANNDRSVQTTYKSFAVIEAAYSAAEQSGVTVTLSITPSGTSDYQSATVFLYAVRYADSEDITGGVRVGVSSSNSLNTTDITEETAGVMFVAAVEGDIDTARLGTPTSSNASTLYIEENGNTNTVAMCSGCKTVLPPTSTNQINLDAAGASAAKWVWVTAEIRLSRTPPLWRNHLRTGAYTAAPDKAWIDPAYSNQMLRSGDYVSTFQMPLSSTSVEAWCKVEYVASGNHGPAVRFNSQNWSGANDGVYTFGYSNAQYVRGVGGDSDRSAAISKGYLGSDGHYKIWADGSSWKTYFGGTGASPSWSLIHSYTDTFDSSGLYAGIGCWSGPTTPARFSGWNASDLFGTVTASWTEGSEAGEDMSETAVLSVSVTNSADAGEAISLVKSAAATWNSSSDAGDLIGSGILLAATVLSGAEAGESIAASASVSAFVLSASDAGDVLSASGVLVAYSLSGSDAGDSISSGKTAVAFLTLASDAGDSHSATGVLGASIQEDSLAAGDFGSGIILVASISFGADAGGSFGSSASLAASVQFGADAGDMQEVILAIAASLSESADAGYSPVSTAVARASVTEPSISQESLSNQNIGTASLEQAAQAVYLPSNSLTGLASVSFAAEASDATVGSRVVYAFIAEGSDASDALSVSRAVFAAVEFVAEAGDTDTIVKSAAASVSFASDAEDSFSTTAILLADWSDSSEADELVRFDQIVVMPPFYRPNLPGGGPPVRRDLPGSVDSRRDLPGNSSDVRRYLPGGSDERRDLPGGDDDRRYLPGDRQSY